MTETDLERDMRTQMETWQASLRDVGQGMERLRAAARPGQLDTLLLTGCGSSYYLAQAVAGVAWAAGIRALAVPASDVLLKRVDSERFSSAAGFSRSGDTTEVVEAMRTLRGAGVFTVGISTSAQADLSKVTDLSVLLPSGKENTVVMTKSFSTMLLAAAVLLEDAKTGRQSIADFILAQPPLSDASFDSIRKAVGTGFDHFIFLGSGPFYGVAAEAMLKVKEMAYVWSEVYHPLELRHGFESTVSEGTLVVLLASTDPARAAMERPVVAEMERLGARSLVIEAPIGAIEAVAQPFRDAAAALLAVPYMQYLALSQCVATGVNPAVPRHSSPVVKIAFEGPEAV